MLRTVYKIGEKIKNPLDRFILYRFLPIPILNRFLGLLTIPIPIPIFVFEYHTSTDTDFPKIPDILIIRIIGLTLTHIIPGSVSI